MQDLLEAHRRAGDGSVSRVRSGVVNPVVKFMQTYRGYNGKKYPDEIHMSRLKS